MTRAAPPRSTAAHAWERSDATPPPETEPSIAPSSPTTSFEPIGRGAERRVAMTVATARFTRPTLATARLVAAVLAEAVVALGGPATTAGTARGQPLRLDEQRVHQRRPENE